MQLKRDDWEMIRRIDGVKPSDRLSVDSLYNRLAIEPLSTLLRHVRWCWHVSCIEGWVSSHCFSLDVVGKHDKRSIVKLLSRELHKSSTYIDLCK